MPDESYIELVCREQMNDDAPPSFASLLHQEKAGVVAEFLKADLTSDETPNPMQSWAVESIIEVRDEDRAPEELPQLLIEVIECYSEGRDADLADASKRLIGSLINGAVAYCADPCQEAMDKVEDDLIEARREYYEEEW